MGKGAGLETHGWGAIGAQTGVKYGATWTNYMPTDTNQMSVKDTPTRRRRLSAPTIQDQQREQGSSEFSTIPGPEEEAPLTSPSAAGAQKSSSACTIL
jgi:hypothetical protein